MKHTFIFFDLLDSDMVSENSIREDQPCYSVHDCCLSFCFYSFYSVLELDSHSDSRLSINVNLIGSVMDINNPLYLHPSDTLGISLIPYQLYGSYKYNTWSWEMWISLLAKNKIGYWWNLSKAWGGIPNSLVVKMQCNSSSWIMNAVSTNYLEEKCITLSFLLWKDKYRFDKMSWSIIFAVHQEIHSLVQETLNISVYFTRQLWESYSIPISLPSCKCENTKKLVEHKEHQNLIQFRMGFNQSCGA